MLYPNINNLIKGENRSRYSLVIAVAKQARRLSERAEAEGEKLPEKPIKMAVMTFADGSASYSEPQPQTEEE